MRVRIRTNRRDECPPEIAKYMHQEPTLTNGKEYEVYALSLADGRLAVHVMDDDWSPDWILMWAVDITDPGIPPDWICFSTNTILQFVAGPPFIAESQKAYTSLVESEADAVDLFRKYVDSKNKEKEDELE